MYVCSVCVYMFICKEKIRKLSLEKLIGIHKQVIVLRFKVEKQELDL